MPVLIDIEENIHPIDAEVVSVFSGRVLAVADENEAELSLSFVSDRAMRDLNKQYRNIDKPTDVLSFSAREGETVGQDFILGDIVISVDTAKRQAVEFERSLEQELCELAFHGILHLLGFDHDESLDRWVEKEQSLLLKLRQLGAGPMPKGMLQTSDVHAAT